MTKQQAKLLRFIKAYIKETEASPSFKEMKIAMKLKSSSGISRLIDALEERGFITRFRNRARSIEIFKRK